MIVNVQEILSSWRRAKNPTPREQWLAEKRLNICASCEFAGKALFKTIPICTACGCPLDKKAYSLPSPKACPKGFWSE